jgi:large subunit ribosomal protein L25
MASQFTLTPIQAKTKGAVKQLRRSGFVPVSIQHKGMPTAHYQLEAKALDEFIRRYGEASFIDLMTVPDNVHQRAIVRGIQRDPITQKLLQVTFQQVRSDDRVKTHVPLYFQGEPEEVKHGTHIAQHALDTLEIECAADSLPAHIDVDISGLAPGHPIRVSDLPAHPHYRILAAPDTTLASLSSTQQGKEEATGVTEEEEAAAEA